MDATRGLSRKSPILVLFSRPSIIIRWSSEEIGCTSAWYAPYNDWFRFVCQKLLGISRFVTSLPKNKLSSCS